MIEEARERGESRRRARGFRGPFALGLLLVCSLLAVACFETEIGEPFYGKVVVPRTQELRWSDGGLPRIFDPARAAAPPDTDAVRAIYEGLTDYEPETLRPLPAVALKWETPDGGRTWFFHLREDARWSNGDAVTAHDFVRSWQRTLRLGESAPHANLLTIIAGARPQTAQPKPSPTADAARNEGEEAAAAPHQRGAAVAHEQRPEPRAASDANEQRGTSAGTKPPEPFGAVALDERTLKVTLARPDESFPSLVAHPVFRPVHELSPPLELPARREEEESARLMRRGDIGIVTNGAFRLSELSGDSVVLERDADYWDAPSVRLERVTFVNGGDAEQALAAYRAGEVDAVTNAAFEPLALKLLTPYEDFRRETFAALNYYSFNTTRPPFNDRRVRTAFALALDAERLAADALGGASEPARRFLPFGAVLRDTGSAASAGDGQSKGRNDKSANEAASEGEGESESEAASEGVAELRQDVGRARRLLAEAGYPNGENFPRVRLLVNRSEQQRLVALAVARMWREVLGVETEIIIRPWEEYEAMLRAGDYDIARRSLVMQTLDEAANVRQLFGGDEALTADASSAHAAAPPLPSPSPSAATPAASSSGATAEAALPAPLILTEAEALRELPAIPLHFASSYALVKPYVVGFSSNLLDAPSLKHVQINTAWTQPTPTRPAAIIETNAR
jgi:oligopeptide transport system substrate-binding protein